MCDAIASGRESGRCLASERNVHWESVSQENGKDDVDSTPITPMQALMKTESII
jgi:hypothetical protein